MTGSVPVDREPLRLATLADAESLAVIHAEAFNHPWDATAIADLLGQDGIFGIHAPDGFILCRAVVDEAEILTLAVRPGARRQGLARRLTAAASAMARGLDAERLFLEVAQDNVAARGLYEAAGFVETGRRRGYYASAQGRTDALILVLNLRDGASHEASCALS